VIELVWSPRAVADLDEIRAYIAADSPAYAELTVRRLLATAERLRSFPELGRLVPERHAPEIRELISGQFRIVYRRGGSVAEIVTVFRSSRQFPDVAT
jgi:plasmid stabilization system protein ParE